MPHARTGGIARLVHDFCPELQVSLLVGRDTQQRLAIDDFFDDFH